VDRVGFLLGAGFSAPLGLPVMSNFFLKSKDLFASDPTRYGHFSEMFDKIRDMFLIEVMRMVRTTHRNTVRNWSGSPRSAAEEK
jgi:hypothetical protein